ncbi:hypothetical protein Gbro_0419 [Gordonia bronchialis DSM 43247]|uniref:Uncharacterized protein n=1 Tax=Gordonia bronchialis (strain ATCC 25592 / DSM 43247 / BCRC 13721 / JCM 3198 / KCTC 3076 / NBRC 16047 / NCTC 10667) TaxID=526226 RepID=D0LDD3_GORB4|nr:hypothetical protein Gbro_0419 [Gordonia bronchialis DSM 43247]STQ62524.1 Uncharacterised protein [Gordonia bronchialis]
MTAESFDPERISSPDMRAMFTFLSGDGYSVDIPALHERFPDVGWQSSPSGRQRRFGAELLSRYSAGWPSTAC